MVQRFTHEQAAHGVRHQDLARTSLRPDPRRKDYRRTEHVAVFFDGFAGRSGIHKNGGPLPTAYQARVTHPSGVRA
jgi:hypothetical protein